MTQRRPRSILISTGFVTGLSILLVNDFILKQTFHNWFTGKLSDFAGLFIFALFLSEFLPRWRIQIYLVTACGFTLWKTSYAQPLIEGVNALSSLTISRTEDITDLVALLVLPVSYLYGMTSPRIKVDHRDRTWYRRVPVYAIGIISVFAFTATSAVDDQIISYHKEYLFNVSRGELIRELYNTDLQNVSYLRVSEDPLYEKSEDRDLYTGHLRQKICTSTGMVYMNVYTRDADNSSLELNFILYSCDSKLPEHERAFLDDFEQEVVDRLRQQQMDAGQNKIEE